MPQALLSGNVVFEANELCVACHGRGLRPVLHQQQVGVEVCQCVQAKFVSDNPEVPRGEG